MSDPKLRVPVGDLRVTPMTVGVHEVTLKHEEWSNADKHKWAALLRSQTIPAVRAPKKRHDPVDDHHFASALLKEKAAEIAADLLADLSHFEEEKCGLGPKTGTALRAVTN